MKKEYKIEEEDDDDNDDNDDYDVDDKLFENGLLLLLNDLI